MKVSASKSATTQSRKTLVASSFDKNFQLLQNMKNQLSSYLQTLYKPPRWYNVFVITLAQKVSFPQLTPLVQHVRYSAFEMNTACFRS